MYSEKVLAHFHNPRNAGSLEDATNYGVAGSPGDGPYMELWLKVDGDIVQRAGFATYGCPAAVACGSLVTQLVTGRTLGIARKIEPADLIKLLGGLPEGK